MVESPLMVPETVTIVKSDELKIVVEDGTDVTLIVVPPGGWAWGTL
jgi:hypothetical protein